VKCEYLIVGGGVYGCGLAWQLASRGHDVVVLERDRVASGSSGGPGARGVRAGGRDPRELPLARRAQELWPSLDGLLDGSTGYRRTGGLTLVEQEVVGVRGGRVSMSARAWVQNRAGVETHVLTAQELRELEPNVSTDVTHAVYCPNDGVATQEATTRVLASAARTVGARILEEIEVIGMTWDSDRVTTVITARGPFYPSRAVVVTANTGSAAVVGRAIPTWRVVPQIIVVRPTQSMSIEHLVGHDSRSLSLKSGRDGTVQISGGWRGRWNDATGCGEVAPAVVSQALDQAVAVYPSLAGAQVLTVDASRDEACSPDGIPIIDLLPGSTNVYLAANWSAHGFALFPAVVESLADWLCSGERPEILGPFAFGRFPIASPAQAVGQHSLCPDRK